MATPALLSIRQLRRARLVLSLAVLIPTLVMSAIGVLLVTRADSVITVVVGVIVLALCLAYIAGYVLSWIFVGKGASAALLQADFLSSVSHELRTPLTSIRLLMEALGDGRLPADEQTAVVKLLTQECDRLDVLVGRLLEVARLDSGRQPLQLDTLDAAELARDAVAAFDAMTLGRPTTINVVTESGLTFAGDHALLVRALANLLHNAWKYTGDDKRIELRIGQVGRRIELAVADNGIGLVGAEHKLVFQRFVRSQGAIDRGTPGVGLGLAFVRAIARNHRGKVFARPRRGGGTEVVMRLRRRKAQPAASPTFAACPTTARPTPRPDGAA